MVRDFKTLGILIGDLVRDDELPKRPKPGIFDRLVQAAMQKVSPAIRGIVGVDIAATSLTRAIVTHGTMDRYDIFVLPKANYESTEALLQTPYVGGQVRHICVHPYSSLFNEQLNNVGHALPFTAWFDPGGILVLPFELRDKIFRQIFPITVVHHTFNQHWMLHAWILRLLLTPTYPCDSIVCTSGAARRALLNVLDHITKLFNQEFHTDVKFRGRLDLIPLCVDTERFRPRDKAETRRRLGLPTNTLLLLCLGRLSLADKMDPLPLVRVFEQLVKDNPARNLLLIIAGTQRKGCGDTVQRFVSSSGLEGKVRVLGEFPHQQRHLLHAAADIFVSPADNIQETSGLTPIEAMACGVPQVVANWDGYRDSVVHGETGFLVPTYWAKCDTDLCDAGTLRGWEYDYLSLAQSVAIDLNRMREYLQLLMDSEDLRIQLGIRSRERAVHEYSFPSVAKQYEALWEELAKSSRGQFPLLQGRRYTRPAFFDAFAHYASTLLTDGAFVGLALSGRASLGAERILPAYREYSEFTVMDEGLLRQLLLKLAAPPLTDQMSKVSQRSHDRPESAQNLGEVVGEVAHKTKVHPDRVRRHLLWLVKHGLVEVTPENSSLETS